MLTGFLRWLLLYRLHKMVGKTGDVHQRHKIFTYGCLQVRLQSCLVYLCIMLDDFRREYAKIFLRLRSKVRNSSKSTWSEAKVALIMALILP